MITLRVCRCLCRYRRRSSFLRLIAIATYAHSALRPLAIIFVLALSQSSVGSHHFAFSRRSPLLIYGGWSSCQRNQLDQWYKCSSLSFVGSNKQILHFSTTYAHIHVVTKLCTVWVSVSPITNSNRATIYRGTTHTFSKWQPTTVCLDHFSGFVRMQIINFHSSSFFRTTLSRFFHIHFFNCNSKRERRKTFSYKNCFFFHFKDISHHTSTFSAMHSLLIASSRCSKSHRFDWLFHFCFIVHFFTD